MRQLNTGPWFQFCYLKVPTASTPLPPQVANNLKFFPWLKDAVGAMDGPHILNHAFPESALAAHCNRKVFSDKMSLLLACSQCSSAFSSLAGSVVYLGAAFSVQHDLTPFLPLQAGTTWVTC
jgi:hypothetical protein